ncbi:unnamed protein product [Clonostachys byssicola]|uniref:Transcription factor domain-containing protein n=1 Tax=Clonostachys byssicola TaxID=160290 RepID=A0A9N9UQ93_9HYPO|nr:unnamed protein product [Clonostachys byssicola]
MRTPSSVGDTPGADNTQQVGSADSIIDGALVLLDPDFANLDVEQAGWDTPNLGFVADVGLGEFLNAQETNNPHFSPESSCFVNHSTPPAGQSSRKQPELSPHLAIPASLSNSVRSLIQRPKRTAASQRITNLTLHTLKSYPLIMLRDKALPPFIHPSLLSSNLESDMEPLSNCISLMHMIGGQVKGTRKLFWKNVAMECCRFSEDYSRFNKWELLAAMHALSIYILLRLDEGETEHNNFDSLIVRAVIVIAQKLCTGDITCHTQCALCNNGLEMSWKEWIFRESRRRNQRLAVVYRVVNMLIYFEPAAMCDMPHEFILAPLPAKKQLWEASDEFTWKAESQREPGVQVSFGLASDGEVVQLGDDRLSCSDAWLSHRPSDGRPTSRSNARWEEWCSGIDGFGSLVMLAASLIV